MRRTLLAAALAPLVLVAVALGLVGPAALSLVALVPLAVLGWGWWLLGRNWRSWRYVLREDDLVISHGVLFHAQTVVPYGRMQLVEVSVGPVLRAFGLARLHLHTAAARTDASLPGIAPADAELLRDRLAELGEARAAVL